MRGARLTPLRGGGPKGVFRVEHPRRGAFVLRSYPEPPEAGEGRRADPRFRTGPGLRSPETLRAQLAWLSELRRETGLAVPGPVPLPDGSLLGRASFADLPPGIRLLRRVSPAYRELYRPDHPGRHFALLSWVPGESKGGDLLSLEDVARVGALAARMHRFAESRRALESRALPRWDWHWPFGGSAPLWDLGERFYSEGEMDAFREASALLRRDLDRHGYGASAFGVIHRDLTLDNLFWGAGVGVADFDLCGLGHYAFDLSTVLRSLLSPRFGLGGERLRRLKEALFEGYGSVRALPPRADGGLAAFDAMQKVASVNRALVQRTSGATGARARGEPFLRGAVAWLERNYLGAS